MYAQKEKTEKNKGGAIANSVTRKESNDAKQSFKLMDNRPHVKAKHDLILMNHRTLQRQGNGVPSTDERTKSAKVGDRHAPPHPFMDLGGWYKTLMTGRIADLYLTAPGFPGHAQQIQQELTHLTECIEDGLFKGQSLETAMEYESNIKNFIINEAKKIVFDIPKFVFQFSGNSTLAIQRENNKLYVNGKLQ